MKRFILLFCVALLPAFCHLTAAGARLTVSDVYYSDTYGSWGVDIGLDNADMPVCAFQCDVAVPLAFTFATTADGSVLYAFTQRVQTTVLGQASATHQCAPAARRNGTLRLVVFSADNTPVSGTSGAVMFVALQPVDVNSVQTGMTFAANLTNQVLTALVDGEVQTACPDGIINDETLICYDSMGNHVAMYAIGEYPDDDACEADLMAVAADLATNDRVVTVDLTRFMYNWSCSFAPKNPNALFFYNAVNQTVNNENVFVQDGTTGVWTCRRLVLHDDGLAFEMPEGREAVAQSFSFDRTFPAGQWSTVMLPVTLSDDQMAALTDGGVRLMSLGSYDASTARVSYAAATGFEANTPYLLRTETASKVFDALTDVAVQPTHSPVVVRTGQLSMHGNYDWRLISSDGGVFRYGYDVATGDFVKIGRDGRLAPFRCYLELAETSEAKAARRISVACDDSSVTGIESVTSGDTAVEEHVIYTVDGRRVSVSDTGVLPAGVYIVDGRKVIVR